MGIHFLFLTFFSLFSIQSLAQGRCVEMFLKSHKEVRENTVFHNKEVRELFKNGVNSQSLSAAAVVFTQKGTFDIPVHEKGFVAAANVGNHAGNYGRYLWFRDFARVQMGLSTLPNILKDSLPLLSSQKAADAKKVRSAQLTLLGDSLWTDMAVKNIADPNFHMDAASGFKSVIWIRRLLDPFLESRPPTKEEVQTESHWGHKQNDALAVFGNSFLDALAKNQLRADEIPEQARLNLVLLSAYFVRLNFWKMWDVGAWEENMGQRTSSIAMVTSFLERFQDGINKNSSSNKAPTQEDIFFEQLRAGLPLILEKNLSTEVAAITRDALQPQSLAFAIDQAYVLLRERLLDTHKPIIEATNDNPSELRNEDTALIHIFWHPLKRITAIEQNTLLERLTFLERASGYVRYSKDWFLYGSAQVALHESALSPLGTLAIENGNGGYRKATPEETSQLINAYNVKDMDRVLTIAGKDLEAQWTLPDSYLVQIFADAYIKTKNPEYFEKAKTYFLRAAGLITGHGEINSEGLSVEAWRLPEAYVPVRVINSNGNMETLHLVSPNSPLNWSIAEFIIAMDKMKAATDFFEAQ
ncbi:MAG: hypothetical protein IT287_00865 [Bdellovibrionaceae bacterium]|nr:hypothetical protein [Pseudobdellovibrionaceae bacterium]